MIIASILIMFGLLVIGGGLSRIADAIRETKPLRFPKIEITEDPPSRPNSGTRWFVEQTPQ